MTALPDDLRSLRNRVRSDRHATSLPLVVIGAVGFHYVSNPPGPLPSTYGLPLAFVVLWALQWRTERERGVAAGRDDPLLLAFVVFVAISLMGSETWRLTVEDGFPGGFEATVAPQLVATTLAVAALGLRQSNRVLVRWGAVMTVGMLAGWGLEHSSLQLHGGTTNVPYSQLVWQATFLAATIGGLVSYRRETQAGRG